MGCKQSTLLAGSSGAYQQLKDRGGLTPVPAPVTHGETNGKNKSTQQLEDKSKRNPQPTGTRQEALDRVDTQEATLAPSAAPTTRYGNKYAGLVALEQSISEIDGTSVPPFVGLSEADLERIEKGEPLPRQVNDWLESRASGTRLMVRSSGNTEDGIASNAGAYVSVAGVAAEMGSVTSAVQKVAQSFKSAQAQQQTRVMHAGAEERRLKRGVVIQEMVGEPPTPQSSPSHIASGVGFWPAPSGVADTFQIDVAPGHGELVVQSAGPTDTISGVRMPWGETVYRQTVRNKPTRMRNYADGELDFVNNPPIVSISPSLQPAAAQRLIQVLQALAPTHDTGADVEFVDERGSVTRPDTTYVVQQRAQDLDIRRATPSYLPKKEASQYATPLVGRMVVYGDFSASEHATQDILAADSLDEALPQALQRIEDDSPPHPGRRMRASGGHLACGPRSALPRHRGCGAERHPARGISSETRAKRSMARSAGWHPPAQR